MAVITFLGHACFLLEEEGKETLIFDPFLKKTLIQLSRRNRLKQTTSSSRTAILIT
ncbi:MAG: MBL fold metallo-hydrolase [Bacillota bacterium]|nr:MBL fold metallo-hydrolase [Bacillota bacterium]